jgi:hypothetical protein
MLVDNVLERWCGVVEAGPFAMVEGEWLPQLLSQRKFYYTRHRDMLPSM